MSTGARSGDIALSSGYVKDTGRYMKFEDIAVILPREKKDEPLFDNLQCHITVKHTKYKKYKSGGYKVLVLPVKSLPYLCFITTLLMHAMRAGQIGPFMSLDEVAKKVSEEPDLTLKWKHPEWPVICQKHDNRAQLRYTEATGSIRPLEILRKLARKSNVKCIPIIHDIRRGAAVMVSSLNQNMLESRYKVDGTSLRRHLLGKSDDGKQKGDVSSVPFLNLFVEQFREPDGEIMVGNEATRTAISRNRRETGVADSQSSQRRKHLIAKRNEALLRYIKETGNGTILSVNHKTGALIGQEYFEGVGSTIADEIVCKPPPNVYIRYFLTKDIANANTGDLKALYSFLLLHDHDLYFQRYKSINVYFESEKKSRNINPAMFASGGNGKDSPTLWKVYCYCESCRIDANIKANKDHYDNNSANGSYVSTSTKGSRFFADSKGIHVYPPEAETHLRSVKQIEYEIFYCSFDNCGKWYRTLGDLDQHERQKHSDSTACKCPKCGKEATPDSFISHLYCCFNQPPFFCAFNCGYQGNRIKALRKHMNACKEAPFNANHVSDATRTRGKARIDPGPVMALQKQVLLEKFRNSLAIPTN